MRLERFAELRAAGWSWARIGAVAGCSGETARRLPEASREWWAYFLGQATEALYFELEHEAIHVLRGQLRSTDPQVAGAAAGRLLQVVHQAKVRNISAMLASQSGRTSAPVEIDAFFAAAAQVAPSPPPQVSPPAQPRMRPAARR